MLSYKCRPEILVLVTLLFVDEVCNLRTAIIIIIVTNIWLLEVFKPFSFYYVALRATKTCILLETITSVIADYATLATTNLCLLYILMVFMADYATLSTTNLLIGNAQEPRKQLEIVPNNCSLGFFTMDNGWARKGVYKDLYWLQWMKTKRVVAYGMCRLLMQK